MLAARASSVKEQKDWEETRSDQNFPAKAWFFFIYVGVVVASIITIGVYASENSFKNVSGADKGKSPAIRASVPLTAIPIEHLMLAGLSLLEEVDLEVVGEQGPRRMRFDIKGASFDSANNITTFKLSLDQTLIVTPHLSALFDENDSLVAVNLDNQFVEVNSKEEWEKQLAGQISDLLRKYLQADVPKPALQSNGPVGPVEPVGSVELVGPNSGPNNGEERTEPVEEVADLVEQKEGSRRLGKKVYKGYTPNSMRPPGFYGSMAYYNSMYATGYPLYQRTVMPVATPYLSSTIAAPVVLAPQYSSSVTTVITQPSVTAAAYLAPVPSARPSGMSPGDLEVIADLLKSSNDKLKEEILDLTFDPYRVPTQAPSGRSPEAMDALTKALRSSTRTSDAMLDLNYSGRGTTIGKAPRKYESEFTEGYRNGFGDGIKKGENATASLWCSVDKSHPLCARS